MTENNDKYRGIKGTDPFDPFDPFDVTDTDENADDAEDGEEGSGVVKVEIKQLVKDKGTAGVQEAIQWLTNEKGYSQERAEELLRTMFPDAYRRWQDEYQNRMPDP